MVIQSNKEQYFKTIESLAVPVGIVEAKSREIVYINTQLVRLLRAAKKEDYIGTQFDSFHPNCEIINCQKRFESIYQQLKNNQVYQLIESRILNKKQEEIPVIIKPSLVELEGKEYIVGVYEVIEEKAKAFMELQEKREELETIFDNSQMGILYLKNGRYLYKANKRLAEILGYDSPEEMVGISMKELHLSLERYEWFGKHHYEALRYHKEIHIDYEIKKKNGQKIWVRLNGAAIDKNIPADLNKGVIWIVDDIDDYMNLQLKLQEQNKNLQQLLEGIGGISFEIDLQTRQFNYISSNTKKILGYEIKHWKNFESLEKIIHPEDKARVVRFYKEQILHDQEGSIEYRIHKNDGLIVWVLGIVNIGLDDEGKPRKLYGFLIDITEQKEAHIKIEEERRFFQNILDSIDDAVMVIDDEYNVIMMNKAAKNFMVPRYIQDKSKPKCYEVSHQRNTPCSEDEIEHPCPLEKVKRLKSVERVLHIHKDKDGKEHYIELVASPMLDDDGKFIGIIETARDITENLILTQELERKKHQLDFYIYYDKLTQLPNRALFYDRIEQAIKSAKRNKTAFAILLLDLDRFKEINDSLGHNNGDALLVKVSKRLKKVLNEENTIARIGGDEFGILLEQIQDIQDASKIAQSIIQVFKEPFVIQNNTIFISCSIGISIYPNDGKSAESLLKYADNAMYQAKSEDRGGYRFYKKEMTNAVFERIVLETNIRQALQNDEFELYYQPQYNAENGKIVGFEALIRWLHPKLGIIPPSKFIPFAEESSLIIEIDNWVMKQAVKDIKNWLEDGLNPGRVSLNLAIKQLESKNFIETLSKSIKNEKIDPSYLKFEILERDIMKDPKKNLLKLEYIHSLGIEISLDDFGTGQSSLMYLKKFPIDQLKIDKGFIWDINKDDDSNAIVLSIIALAKALKLEIVAEGVETKEQLDFLLSNGCKIIQGYYFSPPVDVKTARELLVKYTTKKEA